MVKNKYVGPCKIGKKSNSNALILDNSCPFVKYNRKINFSALLDNPFSSVQQQYIKSH